MNVKVAQSFCRKHQFERQALDKGNYIRCCFYTIFLDSLGNFGILRVGNYTVGVMVYTAINNLIFTEFTLTGLIHQLHCNLLSRSSKMSNYMGTGWHKVREAKDLIDSEDPKHTPFCRETAFVAIYALFQGLYSHPLIEFQIYLPYL